MSEIEASKEKDPPQTSSGSSDESLASSEPGGSSTGSVQEENSESAEPSVDTSVAETESMWEGDSSLPDESSAESSDGMSELAEVSEPKGKPVDKQKKAINERRASTARSIRTLSKALSDRQIERQLQSWGQMPLLE